MRGRLADLTLTLGGDSMTPAPGNPGVTIEPIRTHGADKRSSQKMELSLHLGTHVDAPYHFDPSGETVERMPLEKYAGEGFLLDVRRHCSEKTPITSETLNSVGASKEALSGKIAIIYTAWAQRCFGQARYYTDGPYLDEEAAVMLHKMGITAVAIDFPIDQHQEVIDTNADTFFPVHRYLLSNGIPHIENLVNLDQLVGKRFDIWALPLRILGGDGSPARVVAQIYD